MIKCFADICYLQSSGVSTATFSENGPVSTVTAATDMW